MKNLYLTVFTFLLVSCIPQVENNHQNLEAIFAAKKFEIEIGVFGCMGGRTDRFKMEKTAEGFLFSSYKTSFEKRIEPNALDSLKSFFIQEIEAEDNEFGFCTGITFFKAYTYSKAIEITDEDCDDKWEILNRILDYQEVWQLEEYY